MNDLGLGVVVSMKDAFSRNAQRIQSSMQSLDAQVAASSERMTRNLGRIQKGTMMIGAGLATLAIPSMLVASTAASQKALGELASLGVQDLTAIENAAESFTNQWAGTSKAAFIGATYDVKSALSSLSDEAVGVFTSMAALTAKATKATTQEMVGTFTSGYGIFKPIMQDMTDMEWATAFSGAMAQTVASFKTNGQQMADAIKNIGAVAASANVPLEEQFAVLGQLQTTMPGSEAGTLYKAFMMKAAEAGDELGLSFTDQAGRLKGITAVLAEIQSLYPDLSQAAAQVELKKAFGSDEALKFVLQMAGCVGTLEESIQSIAGAMEKGTAVTEDMARAMNQDIGARLTLLRQQAANLFEILGRTLLPVVTPFLKGLSRMVLFLQDAARSMPGLTRAALGLTAALGAVLVIAGAVTAAVGIIGVSLPAISVGFAAIGPAVAGAGAALAAWLWPVTLAIGGVIGVVLLLRKAWTSNFGGIQDAVMGAWNRVSLVFQGIKALVTSLSGGVGQMSAEMAGQLEQTGLLGFVITVFRVYYRVRQFLGGMSEAFSRAFGRIREILEPTVRSLVASFGGLFKALFSVLEAFGVVSTAADGSAFRSFGAAIGTTLGVVAQFGAFVLRFGLLPLRILAKTLALVARGGAGLFQGVVQGFAAAAKFAGRFLLPLRLLRQSLVALGKIAYAFWGMLSGDLSLLDGFRAIGVALFDLMATPFRWARDVALGAWHFIRDLFGMAGHFLGAAASRLVEAFWNLPLVATLRGIFGAAKAFLAGDLGFFDAGRKILLTLGKGILSASLRPFNIVQGVLGKIRKLLPFSDAEEGPLSTLTASGRSLVETLAAGMRLSAGLPGKVFGFITQGLLGSIASLGGPLQAASEKALAFASAPLQGLGKLWEKAKGLAKERLPGFQPETNVPPLSNAVPVVRPPQAEVPLGQRLSQGVLKLVPRLDAGMVPQVLSATLLLTPILAGALPQVAPPSVERPNLSAPGWEMPAVAALPVPEDQTFPERKRAFEPVPPLPRAESAPVGQTVNADLRPLLEALLAKLDSLNDRPIEITVKTCLDGREIAESVHRSNEEARIRRYGTL